MNGFRYTDPKVHEFPGQEIIALFIISVESPHCSGGHHHEDRKMGDKKRWRKGKSL
jgi:hypothetical protein